MDYIISLVAQLLLTGVGLAILSFQFLLLVSGVCFIIYMIIGVADGTIRL